MPARPSSTERPRPVRLAHGLRTAARRYRVRRRKQRRSAAGRLVGMLEVAAGALLCTFLCFMSLHFLDRVTQPRIEPVYLRPLDTVLETPDAPDDLEETPEEQAPEKVPELTDMPPVQLSDLEAVLNPGAGGADGVLLPNAATRLLGRMEDVDRIDEDSTTPLYSLADLDQAPRITYQPNPVLSDALRARTPAKLSVIFMVDPRGAVDDAKVQRSSDQQFDEPTLKAVRRWRFTPGRRNGEAVPFRMRVPITYPKDPSR